VNTLGFPLTDIFSIHTHTAIPYPHTSSYFFLACLLGVLVHTATGAVFAGRLVSTPAAYYDTDDTIPVTVLVPDEILDCGVWVDLIPLSTTSGAVSLTMANSSTNMIMFNVTHPETYNVHLRVDQTGQCANTEVWAQYNVVVVVLAGNISMAISMIVVIFTTVLILGGFVCVGIPLYVLPLPFAVKH